MRNTLLCAVAVTGVVGIATAFAETQTAATESQPTTTYTAALHSLNSKVTGARSTGEARFSIAGGTLTIEVDAAQLPPSMVHLQHFHGFADDRDASCPTEAADANKDGIIDLIETETTSGTTMVPFHDDPVSMEIVRETYPKANAEGTFQYKKTVAVKDLEAAFAKAFGDASLDLDRRVVFVHGVPEAKRLPDTVASLGPIPAQVTLPIACGEIKRVKK
jgi:hypothetical protein